MTQEPCSPNAPSNLFFPPLSLLTATEGMQALISFSFCSHMSLPFHKLFWRTGLSAAAACLNDFQDNRWLPAHQCLYTHRDTTEWVRIQLSVSTSSCSKPRRTRMPWIYLHYLLLSTTTELPAHKHSKNTKKTSTKLMVLFMSTWTSVILLIIKDSVHTQSHSVHT